MPPRPVSPTHFICIPLSSPQLARSLSAFRADVTSPASFALPAAAIRPLGPMHLTLGVMPLQDDETLQRARDVLKGLRLRELVAGGGGDGSQELRITLKGLHALRNPAKTTVVYAPPEDPTGVLYNFCSRIKTTFQDAGLMPKEDRPLLLHATVINTIYVPGGRGKNRLEIDAREIVGRYDDFMWMEGVEVDRVTICKMGAKKVEGEDDERYEVVEEVLM